MVICIAALVVLAVLSIFSAKYRKWAKEAFDCVARRVTLRPCRTGFDEKVKAKIVGKLMKKNMGLARFTHKHFETMSWIFTIVFFVSLVLVINGFANLVIYGTCDPITGNCIFNPGGDPNRVLCPFEGLEPQVSVATIGGFMDIESAIIEGTPKVYFFGTTWCPHCRWERPIFMEITEKFKDYIEFKKIEIDLEQDSPDISVFNHYSPEGRIPLLILGGKYFRIGSGETIGEEMEKQVLTAILCKITDNPIAECKSPEITELINSI